MKTFVPKTKRKSFVCKDIKHSRAFEPRPSKGKVHVTVNLDDVYIQALKELYPDKSIGIAVRMHIENTIPLQLN